MTDIVNLNARSWSVIFRSFDSLLGHYWLAQGAAMHCLVAGACAKQLGGGSCGEGRCHQPPNSLIYLNDAFFLPVCYMSNAYVVTNVTYRVTYNRIVLFEAGDHPAPTVVQIDNCTLFY